MSRYWQTLFDNLAFLIFVMPLVGAGLVAASSRLGLDAIRRTALTNALLTLALALLMVATFDPNRAANEPDAGRYQMTTSWRWLQRESFHIERREVAEQGRTDVLIADRSGPNVRIALGVDGISLWFIVLAATLMIPATCAGSSSDRERPALFYGLLLLLQSLLIGVFAAIDVVFFLICLELASLSLVFLLARWGGQQRLTVVKGFFGFSLAATLMIGLGLTTLVVSHARMRIDDKGRYPEPTFSIQELLDGGNAGETGARIAGVGELIYDNEMARHFWSSVSAWIFLPLVFGFAMQAAIVPAHAWPLTTNALALPSVCVLHMGVAFTCGCYGIARFVVPLFPPYTLGLIPWMPGLAVLGGLYAGLLALTHSGLKRTATLVCVGQMSLATAGLFSFNNSGVIGGLLLTVSTGFSIAAVMIVLGMLEGGNGDVALPTNIDFRKRPRVAFCLFFSTLALVATPGFGTFAGLLLTLRGLFASGPNAEGSPLSVGCGLLASLCFVWAFVRCFQAHRRGTGSAMSAFSDRPLEQGTARDLTCWEVSAVAFCLGIAAWIGICPSFFAARIGHSPSGVHAADNAAGHNDMVAQKDET